VSRFRDFDAYWAEQDRIPLRFKVRGRDYTLPPSLPAAVIPRVARLQERVAAGELESMENLGPSESEEVALALFGRTTLNDLYDHGLSVDELAEIITWAVAEYTGADLTQVDTAGDGQGEAPPPATGGDWASSLNGGPSSRPTSPASTT
jgi:hypothetical protein